MPPRQNTVRATSKAAFSSLDTAHRDAVVLRAMRALDTATDRAVAIHLGFADMNAVRPTITRLLDLGKLVEVDIVLCPDTRRRVRRCRIAPAGTKRRPKRSKSVRLPPKTVRLVVRLLAGRPWATAPGLIHRALLARARSGVRNP